MNAPSVEQLIEEAVERAVARAVSGAGPEKIAYSVTEAAEALGTSEPTVRRLIGEGRIPTVDLGNSRRLIPVDALRRFANGEPAVARLRTA